MADKQDVTHIDRDALKAEIRAILVGLAKQRKTISYSGLCAQIHTAYLHHRAPIFHNLLREISEDEVADGEPITAVLVVQKQSGRPGAGFYKTAAAKGYDVSDPEAYWQMRFDELCDYWSEREDDA
jgi:hypothetical protein